jgi:hypothetical protein
VEAIAISVNNRRLDPRRIAVRDLNFGQWPGCPQAPYRLSVRADEMAALIGRIYADFVKDAIDFPNLDDSQATEKLRELGWPDLKDLARSNPDLIGILLAQHIGVDLLHRLFSEPKQPHDLDYVLNSIDAVVVEGDSIVIEGAAFAPCKSAGGSDHSTKESGGSCSAASG